MKLAIALLLCAAPWWDDYPLIVETTDLSVALDLHADIAQCASQNDPNWGLFGQKVTERPNRTRAFQAAGLRVLSYYETYGQSYCFVGELGEGNLLSHHWNWQRYGGGRIAWIGMHSYWDDLPYARPWTRMHPRFGGPPLRYPDGAIATGWTGGSTDPREHRVFDAACSKDVWGNLSLEYEFNDAVADATELLRVDGRGSGLVMFKKDSACPAWNEYARAAVLHAAERGLDGMWTDNFSPWDSFGNPPLSCAFGEWSVARFRDYLEQHFSARELSELGVRDVDGFDIRVALRERVREWGGDDTNVKDPRWKDTRWLDDPLWLAYLVYKRQTGSEALAEYYHVVKEAAREAGKPEFLVAGNDIPGFSLGWARDLPDMVSTEVSAGWSLDGGPRGFMLPPRGRLAPKYKLAHEHARGRFVNVWMYLDGYEEYRNRPELARVLYYEMLGAHTLPMLHPRLARCAGTPESNRDFFAFVQRARGEFGAREPVQPRIGVLYSSSSVLCGIAPGGFVDFARQPHMFAFYGWTTALEELHAPWRAVPEWKLDADALRPLSVLILPEVEVLDAEAAAVITPWVESGGRLIVTGSTGRRYGEARHFARRKESSVRERIEKAVYLKDDPGLRFYLNENRRASSIAEIRQQIADEELFSGNASLPRTVQVNLYEDRHARRLFVDVNNLDIDLERDEVHPAPPITLRVRRPAWLGEPTARVLAPDATPEVSLEVDAKLLRIDLQPFTHYASIVIEAPDD